MPAEARELIALAASTWVSEDLACAAAGALVASGALRFPPAVVACLAGIYLGDLALFVAGRLLGRRVVERAARRWLPGPALELAVRRLNDHGAAAALTTRFLPGSRLPVYLAAGALGVDFRRFAVWLLAAAAIWTPLAVGVAAGGGAVAEALVPHSPVRRVALVAAALAAILMATRAWRGRYRG